MRAGYKHAIRWSVGVWLGVAFSSALSVVVHDYVSVALSTWLLIFCVALTLTGSTTVHEDGGHWWIVATSAVSAFCIGALLSIIVLRFGFHSLHWPNGIARAGLGGAAASLLLGIEVAHAIRSGAPGDTKAKPITAAIALQLLDHGAAERAASIKRKQQIRTFNDGVGLVVLSLTLLCGAVRLLHLPVWLSVVPSILLGLATVLGIRKVTSWLLRGRLAERAALLAEIERLEGNVRNALENKVAAAGPPETAD